MSERTSDILQRQSLEWLVNSATEAMLITDQDGRIALTNPPLRRLFGYTAEEIIDQPVEILLPERMRGSHVSMRDGYAQRPRARAMGNDLTLTGVHRDGSEFPVEISLSPLQTEEGERLVLATVHDVTRRKRAEAAMQENETRMRAIFETAVDAIITIDEHGIVERCNAAAERLFGWRAEELAGQNVKVLMPEPFRGAHDGYLSRYQATGEKKIIGIGREVMGQRRDGSVFPIDLAVAEMRIGERRMFTGMVRDISERKAAEQHMARLVQELGSANEELTNFAYVVSHDLKAPLRAIGSLADWLQTDYADKFDDEGREHMRLLISRVHRMGGLIDGILQYSRVGRIRETPAMVDFDRVVRDAIDLLAPPAHITVTVAPGLPALRIEATRIQQVFQNLISNAIKYMDKAEGRITVSGREEADGWRFSVADNGPGIEARHFERIFQLFQTLAPRDKVESTGVGLALVKKIVEMYGGAVSVESVMGQGTTFSFTLPREMPTPLSAAISSFPRTPA